MTRATESGVINMNYLPEKVLAWFGQGYIAYVESLITSLAALLATLFPSGFSINCDPAGSELIIIAKRIADPKENANDLCRILYNKTMYTSPAISINRLLLCYHMGIAIDFASEERTKSLLCLVLRRYNEYAIPALANMRQFQNTIPKESLLYDQISAKIYHIENQIYNRK